MYDTDHSSKKKKKHTRTQLILAFVSKKVSGSLLVSIPLIIFLFLCAAAGVFGTYITFLLDRKLFNFLIFMYQLVFAVSLFRNRQELSTLLTKTIGGLRFVFYLFLILNLPSFFLMFVHLLSYIFTAPISLVVGQMRTFFDGSGCLMFEKKTCNFYTDIAWNVQVWHIIELLMYLMTMIQPFLFGFSGPLIGIFTSFQNFVFPKEEFMSENPRFTGSSFIRCCSIFTSLEHHASVFSLSLSTLTIIVVLVKIFLELVGFSRHLISGFLFLITINAIWRLTLVKKGSEGYFFVETAVIYQSVLWIALSFVYLSDYLGRGIGIVLHSLTDWCPIANICTIPREYSILQNLFSFIVSLITLLCVCVIVFTYFKIFSCCKGCVKQYKDFVEQQERESATVEYR
ncbi:hypothetical protein RCL1_000508 [Eukaryota sp. TZLM3-RCL]